MNKLTNEEIARVFAMYLGCDIEHPDKSTAKVVGIIGDQIRTIHNEYNMSGCCLINGKDKLLLTPLSKITDEHAMGVQQLNTGISYFDIPEIKKEGVFMGRKFIEIFLSGGGLLAYEVYQYLISKRYDIPLWFGLNHWANGKTPIELGIAIESL